MAILAVLRRAGYSYWTEVTSRQQDPCKLCLIELYVGKKTDTYWAGHGRAHCFPALRPPHSSAPDLHLLLQCGDAAAKQQAGGERQWVWGSEPHRSPPIYLLPLRLSIMVLEPGPNASLALPT